MLRQLAISELLLPRFQNESWGATFHIEMSISCTFIVLQIHVKGFTPGLVSKKRPKAARKRLIRGLAILWYDMPNLQKSTK